MSDVHDRFRQIPPWLGNTDLTTTNRYAEISTKTKLAALRATELSDTTEAFRNQANLEDRRISRSLSRQDYSLGNRP
jgi:hypothetical protein